MIVKDATVCNFVDGKTSFYTPQMELHYDEDKRPFSVHKKIEGYTLGDRIYHLSHTALTGAAYDVAKFIKELSNVDLRGAPEKVKYPLSDFLHELDYEHYAKHIDADHQYIKETELKNLVHGDLNLGNHNLSVGSYYMTDAWAAGLNIYDTATGEVWELKRNSFAATCSSAYAINQLNKYVSGI